MFIVSLLKLIREQKPDALVVAMEGKCKPFRNELYSEYKANRTRPTPSFILQRDRVEEILSIMHIPVLRANGYEADDIIGTVAKRAQRDGFEVFICSVDKDMLQLVDHDVHIFNMKTGEYMDLDGVVEKIGVSPDKFIDYLALQGDPGDNVPGVPGIGPKTAMRLIRRYDSIENILQHVGELSDRLKNSLSEFKDRLLLGKKLVTIDCAVPISLEDYDDFAMKEYDKDGLRQIFTELGFNRLIDQLGLDEDVNLGETR
jgi:DNA polymerase-1